MLRLPKLFNDTNYKYTILDIEPVDYNKCIEFYKLFPNALIYIQTSNVEKFKDFKNKLELFLDRITLLDVGEINLDRIDICHINNEYFSILKGKLSFNKIKLLMDNTGVIYDNTELKLEMFCVYHKNYYFREDNFYFTFFGVNEIYPKEKNCNNILEYNLKTYNPFLQKRGYMETSAYLHIYWNKLYEGKDMIGVSQYDMVHKERYNNLNKEHIYILNINQSIVSKGEWNIYMFPNMRNLDFLVKSYNLHFNKNYSKKNLENIPFSLYQTNIYPVKIFKKLCTWLEKLTEEIYPWAQQTPYETHWGACSGYLERALSLFNAFQIYEGTFYENLNITHGIDSEIKEHYGSSFLNNYEQDIHCQIVHSYDNTFIEIKSEIQQDSLIKETKDNLTKFYYLDKLGNRSKELMFVGNGKNKNFNWQYNILNDNLDKYTIFYKKIKNNIYNIFIR